MSFLTREITSIKVCGSNLDFSTIDITSKKVRGNDVDFSISKIISKKHVKVRKLSIQVGSVPLKHVGSNIRFQSSLILINPYNFGFSY